MSASEDVGQVKPKGDGLFTYDDVDTRMKYKEIQGKKKKPKIKVEKRVNRQRRIM